MPSLLDLHLDKLPDRTIVPGGEEYQLEITKGEIKPSKSSERDVLHVSFKIVDQLNSLPIFEALSLPCEADSEDLAYNFSNSIKEFMLAFGINLKNPGEPSEWKGLVGWAFLKTDQYEGRDKNTVSRFIAKK